MNELTQPNRNRSEQVATNGKTIDQREQEYAEFIENHQDDQWPDEDDCGCYDN